MTFPVIFAVKKDSRIDVMLGPRVLGEIIPCDETLSGKALGTVGAHYLLYPFGDDSGKRVYGASSITAARRSILVRLAEAHEETDAERYAPMIAALREQAEGER